MNNASFLLGEYLPCKHCWFVLCMDLYLQLKSSTSVGTQWSRVGTRWSCRHDVVSISLV